MAISAIRTDQLNIGLILLSALVAYWFPLELFVLSYVILGPLHYLTEINWLNDKAYFTSDRGRLWLIIGLTAALALVIPKLVIEYAPLSPFRAAILAFNEWSNSIIFLCLLVAAAYPWLKTYRAWAATLLLGLGGALYFNNSEYYTTLVGLMVPTILHVYVFTLLFMLYGARKNGSGYGYGAVLLALSVPLVYALLSLQGTSYLFPDSLKQVYIQNSFHYTPVLFSKLLGWSDGSSFFFYEQLELKLMMFVAFIYCYHYLNWFSKTTVIQWHRTIDRKKAGAIGMLWLVQLALFYYDFRLGFLVSLFFSFLHVILEFPLNMLSIRGLLIRRA